MKKIITLLSVMLLTITAVKAQQLNEGNSMINLGVGLNSYYTTGSGYSVKLPPVEGSYEYMITENISIGAFVGAFESEYDSPFANELDTSFSYFHGGALGNFHFVNDDKFNAYIGARLGYVSASVNNDFLDQFDVDLDYTDSGILYGVQLGGRYFVSEKFAINAELGYGVALLKVGVTFKL